MNAPFVAFRFDTDPHDGFVDADGYLVLLDGDGAAFDLTDFEDGGAL